MSCLLRTSRRISRISRIFFYRGELATYLRPMGSKVPSIYGGSFDEPFKMPAADETAA